MKLSVEKKFLLKTDNSLYNILVLKSVNQILHLSLNPTLNYLYCFVKDFFLVVACSQIQGIIGYVYVWVVALNTHFKIHHTINSMNFLYDIYRLLLYRFYYYSVSVVHISNRLDTDSKSCFNRQHNCFFICFVKPRTTLYKTNSENRRCTG